MKKREDIPEVEIIEQEMSHIPDIIDKEFDKEIKSWNRLMMKVVIVVTLVITIIFLCNN